MTRRGLAVAAVVLALAPATEASAQEALDANCPGPREASTANGSGGNGRFAQTFTAQSNGALTRARAAISKGGISADWVMQVNAVDGSGTPTNAVLAAALIPDSTVANGDTTLTANFTVPVEVTSGQRYALVVTRPGSNSLFVGVRTGICPGQLFTSSSLTGAFTPTSVDLVFEVFVTPLGATQPPDTQPPDTTITRGPKSKTKKRNATFEFSSSEPGSAFTCSLDGGPFEACSSPKEYGHLKRKKHHFEVRATDAAGNVDATPKAFDWKIKKKRKRKK